MALLILGCDNLIIDHATFGDIVYVPRVGGFLVDAWFDGDIRPTSHLLEWVHNYILSIWPLFLMVELSTFWPSLMQYVFKGLQDCPTNFTYDSTDESNIFRWISSFHTLMVIFPRCTTLVVLRSNTTCAPLCTFIQSVGFYRSFFYTSSKSHLYHIMNPC